MDHSALTIGGLEPGDHLCCLYGTEEEHRAVLTPFMRQGLERGEKVLYIADAHPAEVLTGYLREDGLAVEPYLLSGQLRILSAGEAYMREGLFDPDAIIALLGKETQRALDEGYQALRVTGETSWALRGLPGSMRLIEYETKLNRFFPGSRCLAICQYDRRRFDPALLLDVLATHPSCIIGTKVCDNFCYYMPPEDFLGPDLPAAMLRHWLNSLKERKRAEEELEQARRNIEELARREEQRANWLATILDQLPVGVVIARAPDVKIVQANKAAEEIWGMPTGHVEAGSFTKPWRYLWPDGQPVRYEEIALSRAILRGEPVRGDEYFLERPDGSRLNMMANAAPLLEEGKVVGAVAAFWDVTAEREAQRQLKEASRLKDEFLSMASHELKTPVTSIKIYSELAIRRPEVVQERLPEIMATLNRQADQLVALINDLLDVSRLELGRMPMEMRPLDLARLVGEICERSRPLFGERLICSPPEEAILVEGDAVRLEQVLANLLDNARKYAPGGGNVWMRLSRRGDTAVVEVADEGVGISAEHLPHIFERFYKPGPPQSVYSGLGVGLYISKQIVERHRGRIWARSEVGKGSTFSVELPLAARPAPGLS